jgi:hypothetical protein
MNIPAIGSVVEVTTKKRNIYYYSKDEYDYISYKGRIVQNERWVPSDSFSIETGNPNYPISIISLHNVSNVKILKGFKIPVRKFKVKGNQHEYIVTENNKHFSCTCIGFKYHSKCKHITAVKNKLDK